jgi:ACS family tartrate transporter-like MFS transporter
MTHDSNPYASPSGPRDNTIAGSSVEEAKVLDSARRKAYIRLLPILFICYVIAYIDRNNVGFAKLTMSKDLPAFDSAVFGFGAGIFFWGYFLLEIPGSLIVERWSARKWICRIMLTWGVMAALTAFVKTPMQFYIIRFLLGVAEAGFFPGVIVYLTHWFTGKDRARAISIFLIASPIAMMIGPPASALFIDYGTTKEIIDPVTNESTLKIIPALLGLNGWQWIYIIWGIPAVLMGFIVVKYLTDRPRDAKWLTPRERDVLEDNLKRERAAVASSGHMSVLQALTSPKVLLLAFAYFGIVTANYGIEFFLPSILQDWYKLEPTKIAFLVVIPSILVMVGQLLNGWSSDRMEERRWHSVVPVVAGAIMLIVSTFSHNNLILTMVCFTIGATGMKAYMPAFWSLPSLFLTASAAAGSIGMINSIGNLGGFLGPYMLGTFHQQFKSYDYGLYFIAGTSLLSAALIAVLPLRTYKPKTEEPDA